MLPCILALQFAGHFHRNLNGFVEVEIETILLCEIFGCKAVFLITSLPGEPREARDHNIREILN